MAQQESFLRNEIKMTGFDSNCADFSTQAMELGLYLLKGVVVFLLLGLLYGERVVVLGLCLSFS